MTRTDARRRACGSQAGQRDRPVPVEAPTVAIAPPAR